MHAYLIIGASNSGRQEKIIQLLQAAAIKETDQIQLIAPESSIGIEQIREFIQKLSLRPVYSPFIAGVIGDASLLTQQAQHALLKTLEEPPKHAHIYLSAQHTDVLLPTIISRCQLISLKQEPSVSHEFDDILLQLRTISIGKKLEILSQIPKEKLPEFTDCAISYIRNILIINPDPSMHVLIQKLLTVKKYAKNNVNLLHLVEQAFIVL